MKKVKVFEVYWDVMNDTTTIVELPSWKKHLDIEKVDCLHDCVHLFEELRNGTTLKFWKQINKDVAKEKTKEV